MRLSIDSIVLGLMDCTGSSQWFVHEFISKRLALRFETITTNQPEAFSHPQMKEVNFAEAQHFISRALYHLAVGKRLISSGAPTWGLVSFYYSSFFSAQAAIRLRGTTFFRLTYDDQFSRAPTYRLDAVNLVTDRFSVRRASERSTGDHQRVWSAFYDGFYGFSVRTGYADVSPITEMADTERRLAEMHRRHLVNYVPGFAYYELGSPKELRAVIRELERDVRGRVHEALEDADGQLEAGAFLRFRLCCGLLQEIAAANGAYAKAHKDIIDRRKRMLAALDCPKKLARHLERVF